MSNLFNSNFWVTILLNIQSWTITELPGLIIAFIFLIICLRLLAFSLRKLKKIFINRAQKSEKGNSGETEKRINTLIGILSGVIKIILWAVFIMILLKKFGIDIAPLLASAGIVGVAIGFGSQELIRDFISGFFILLENQIRTGDVAIINGSAGTVEKIELRTITLRDFSGVVHIFQNGKINSLSNMTKEWSAAVFDIGVAYKENVEVVIDVMKKVGKEIESDNIFGEKIIEPLEIFGLDKFGDSAIVIKARIKTKPMEQWNVGREYRKRLKNEFDNKNIEIPFPHTTIYWGDEIKPLKLSVNSKQ